MCTDQFREPRILGVVVQGEGEIIAMNAAANKDRVEAGSIAASNVVLQGISDGHNTLNRMLIEESAAVLIDFGMLFTHVMHFAAESLVGQSECATSENHPSFDQPGEVWICA